MVKINYIQMDYSPRKNVELLLRKQCNIKMTEDEHAYICGLIKEKRPKKITEVGIGAGFTTAVILQCLHQYDMLDTEVHSIDLYGNVDFENISVGEIGREAEIIYSDVKHEFHIGNIACSYEEDVKNTDLLILDTTHLLPGEILDFLTLLPLISNNCTVVLHDVMLHYFEHGNCYDKYACCTGLLLSTIIGTKYVNYLPKTNVMLNICAVDVNNDTRTNVKNIFLLLLTTWQNTKYLSFDTLWQYKQYVKKFYNEELQQLFHKALMKNLSCFSK